MLIWILILILIAIVYLYSVWNYSYWKIRNVPYPKPTPFFGNIMDSVFFKKSPGECHQEIYWQYPNERFVGIYQMRLPTLLIRDPELIKQILIKDFEHFMDRGFYTDEEREPLTAHLVNLAGQRWKLLRNKLTPAFSSGKIKQMFSLLTDCSAKLTGFIQTELDNEDGTVEVRELTARFTTDVIGVVAFGLQFEAMTGKSIFREMGKKALQPSITIATARALRVFLPWLFDILKMRTFPNEINSFFTNVVKDTMKFRESTNFQRSDFMQLMIHLKNEDLKSTDKDDILFTDSVIAAQAFVFFLAGFETSSTTLSFCLYELSKNPICQLKALEEIKQLLTKYGSLTYEAVVEMTYTEHLLLETMRMYPPVSNLSRVCTKAYQIPGTEVQIEPGIAVSIPVYALHHDPNLYPEPYTFYPERFNNKDILKSHIYLPFGEGPRVCIGQRFAMIEMKLALAQVILNYEITLSKKTPSTIKIDPSTFILAPIGGLWLNLKERH
ncbi:hypothetical protein O3M35_010098 [Rhynocoris fuscipes]|uniref:Cytochrome P450 n=1 Tax=Rhynocoris fuscipes TaxID=488301 RepID=A0AAW1CYM9_9HEMI